MKVYIGPHKGWFGPYQLADAICWWARKTPDEYGDLVKPRWVHHFGEWLAHGSVEPEPTPERTSKTWLDRRARPKTWLYRVLLWIHSRRERRIRVRIDPWDAWSGDRTLAIIALPLLQRIKETKLGVPLVHEEDFPEHLEASEENRAEAWNWILDEIIFALTSIVDDSWEGSFASGETDLVSEVEEWKDGRPLTYRITHGPRHTYKVDFEGRERYQQRIDRGLILFGKYFRSLWT